jgi:hypothetical protein
MDLSWICKNRVVHFALSIEQKKLVDEAWLSFDDIIASTNSGMLKHTK